PFGDAPEDVRLLQHRYRGRILEIGRKRIEPVSEEAVSVHVVPVAEDTILVVYARAIFDVCPEQFCILDLEYPIRILVAHQIDGLALEFDAGRRRRMDGPPG